MASKERDDFDRLLHSWTEFPAPSGRLGIPVWQSIEVRCARLPWSEQVIDLLRELDNRFARPRAMAAVVAVALLLGVGLAELRTHNEAARVDAEMSARYLAMLDPVSR